MEESSSSEEFASFALLNGDASADAELVATFRVGDNRGGAEGIPEFMVLDPRRELPLASGHLTWDPSYEPGAALDGTAQVRLDLSRDSVRWSVGTHEYLVATRSIGAIRRIEVLVSARDRGEASIHWEKMELIVERDGKRSSVACPCLPRASAGRPMRRSSTATAATSERFRQFAQIHLGRGGIERVRLSGLVTLRAAARPGALGADDLEGRILVFTDRGAPERAGRNNAL